MWIIIGIIVVVVVLFFIAVGGEDDTAVREQAEALRSRFAADKAEYLSQRFGAEPFACLSGEFPAVIGPIDGGIRIAHWATESDHFLDIPAEPRERLRFTPHMREILFSQIVDVAVRQGEVVETFVRDAATPVAVPKKKSVLLRAALGSLALPGGGALIGAATALSPDVKIKTIVVQQEDSRVVKGPPTLSLMLTGDSYSFENITFESLDDANAWARWIEDQRVASDKARLSVDGHRRKP